MLQIKYIRSILLVYTYVCLSVFLLEKTVVPLVHQHHELHHTFKGDSIQQSSDCIACDIAKAMLDMEHADVLLFSFVLACYGVLQLFYLAPRFHVAVIFSSLRGPPALSI